jgi:hypothetical protein
VDEQAQPAQRALSFDPADDVVRKGHVLQGAPQDELPGVKDERLIGLHLCHLGQVIHRLAHVDVRVAGVVEHAEIAVHPEVDAGGLHHVRLEGIDDQAAGLDLLTDVGV